MPTNKPTEFQSRMQQVDELLRKAEQADPATQIQLQELASGLLDVHGFALQRILDHIAKAGDAGQTILDACAADTTIGPVLVLHGLHPLDVETRVHNALTKVSPYLASHGGHVEFLSITSEGAVHLRLHGSCHGCPSSRVTLESMIEQEIYAAAPEITSVVVEGLAEEEPPAPPAKAGFVPLEQLAINGAAAAAAAT